MSFYKELFKYLTALKLPRTRRELNAIIDSRVGGGGGPGGGGNASGVTAFLTSEVVTVPATPDGTVLSFENATTRMTVLIGPNDDTINWVITRINGSGVTSNLAGSQLFVTGLSLDTGYVDITATKDGFTPLTKRFTVTKARQGQQGNPGESGGSVTPDPTAPPTPSNLQAFAGISQFTVSWDAAAYSVGHGPGETIVYAIPRAISNPSQPTFDPTAIVAVVPDPANFVSIPSNPSTRWHIWAKFRSADNYLSDTPAGGVNGVVVTTGQDVSTLLTALTSQITESQLYNDLSTRINLIDAPSSTAGSVNARVAAETSARNTAISTEVVNRNNAIAASASTLSTDYVNRDATNLTTAQNFATSYVQNYTYSTAGVNGAISSQINTLTAAIGNTGGNLINNSNFSVDTNGDGSANGWGPYSVGGTATLTLTTGRSGGQAQRVTWSGTNTGLKGITTTSAITEGGITGGLRGGWLPNTDYVVSWYSRSSAGSAGFGMQVATNVAFASQTALFNPNLSSTVWQRYAYRVTTGSSVPSNAELILSIANGVAATGYVDFADVQVQEGSILTGYSAGDAANLTAALQAETTARINGDTATANAITTLQSTTSIFAPFVTWDFTGATEGWVAYPGGFGTITTGATALTATANSAGELIVVRDLSSSEQAAGSLHDKVRMRLRRTAGSGWNGNLFYGIVSGHSDSGLYFKTAPEPNWSADPNGWAVVEWDMTALTAGGTDWTTNVINRLRFDLVRAGAGVAGFTTFQIDWVAIGSRSSGVSSSVVQQEISTRATQTGSLFAQYTVKLDTNGYVSGFGLASTSTGATPTSSFIIRADSFSIASPTGPGISPVVPFTVQTTPTTINGVSVPVGIYMDSAYIQNGTITNAKIANASIDNLKVSGIDASKINTGLITAAQIDGRNLTIRDGSGNIILAAGSPLAIANIANSNTILNSNITVDANGNLQGAGTVINIANNTSEGSVTTIRFPAGASISVNSSVVAGSLKIRLPAYFTDTMLRFEIEIYEYNSNASATYMVGGYTHSSGWINTFARYIGSPGSTRPVYFGHDGTYACVWIGAGSTTWSYPQVRVKDFLAGYNNFTQAMWATGWAASFSTSGPANVTASVATPTAGGALGAIDTITQGNASTYIQTGAIDNALIGNFIRSNNFNGTIDSSGNITSVGSTGWAIGKAGSAVFDAATIRGQLTVNQIQVVTGSVSNTFASNIQMQGIGTPGSGGGYYSIGSAWNTVTGTETGFFIGIVDIPTNGQTVEVEVRGYVYGSVVTNWSGYSVGNHLISLGAEVHFRQFNSNVLGPYAAPILTSSDAKLLYLHPSMGGLTVPFSVRTLVTGLAAGRYIGYFKTSMFGGAGVTSPYPTFPVFHGTGNSYCFYYGSIVANVI